MLLTPGSTIATEYIRDLRTRAAHEAGRQKCSGAGGEEGLAIGRGSSSSGLVAAQTLLVAIRRY